MAHLTEEEVYGAVLDHMLSEKFESPYLEESLRQDLMADPDRIDRIIAAQNDPTLSHHLETIKEGFGLPSEFLHQQVEGVLLTLDGNAQPAPEVIEDLNEALGNAGLPHGEGEAWDKGTSEGIAQWMYSHSDELSDPALQQRAEEYLNRNIGSQGPDGVTRGVNPSAKDFNIQDVEDCGAQLFDGAVATRNCAREL
jgi:hypothetical protein